MKYNETKAKTLGPKGATLIAKLYDNNLETFTANDAIQVTGFEKDATARLVQNLTKKGILTRLKPGLYKIVPFEFGSETTYFGNQYQVASQIIRKLSTKEFPLPSEYFISHGSAMDIHQMITQPQLSVFVSSTKRIRPQRIMGIEFHFVLVKPEHFFGAAEHWITDTEKIFVSDLERTILDGLKLPTNCGGIIEVAKGLWIKKDRIKVDRLLEYAFKLDVGVIYKRLGFLLELFEIGSSKNFKMLEEKITKSYHLLDPVLGQEGKFTSRWRLRLNITKEEIRAVLRT